jgi:hypothetical protein
MRCIPIHRFRWAVLRDAVHSVLPGFSQPGSNDHSAAPRKGVYSYAADGAAGIWAGGGKRGAGPSSGWAEPARRWEGLGCLPDLRLPRPLTWGRMI